MVTKHPEYLSNRSPCAKCGVKPVTIRLIGSAERTTCRRCGQTVDSSDGDSITPWNQMQELHQQDQPATPTA